MAQNGMANGVPEGLHGASKVLSEPNPLLTTTDYVTVMQDASFVQHFVHSMFESMEYFVSSTGGRLSFNEQDLFKYYLSAVFARVNRSTQPDKRIRLQHETGSVFDQWFLPDIMAYLANQVGRVEAGPKDMVTYYPIWEKDANEHVLDRSEHARITAALRATSSFGVSLARGLGSAREGTPVVMTLTYYGNPGQGHWAYREPFRVSDAVESCLLGIRRSVDYTQLPRDYWPPAKLDESYVWHYMTEVSQFSVKHS